jgi:hypothetical protein
MAPLDHQNVTRLIQAYDELLAERDQLVSTLRRLTLAWGAAREVLNGLSKQLHAPYWQIGAVVRRAEQSCRISLAPPTATRVM